MTLTLVTSLSLEELYRKQDKNSNFSSAKEKSQNPSKH